MLFCPNCANLLVISSETGLNKWACNTCAYEFPITKQMTSRMRLKRKQVDDVLGGDEMWAHADRTQGMISFTTDGGGNSLPSFYLASCDKCNFNSAFFYQLQIRSADEPMTTCAISIILYFLLLLTSGKRKVYRWFPLTVTIYLSVYWLLFLFYFWRCVNCANQWRENWRTSQLWGSNIL